VTAKPLDLRAWLQLVRLPAVFSVWSNILAAHLIATHGSPDLTVLWLQLGITTAIYWGGMVLNDCFDLVEDQRQRPHRPLPAGRISVTAAWGIGLGLLGIAVVMSTMAGPRLLWLTVLLALAVLVYDAWLKHGPAGPLLMGLCRYLNWLMGLAVAPIGMTGGVLALPILLYTTSVTVLSRSETTTTTKARVIVTALLLVLAAVTLVVLHVSGIQSHAAGLAASAALAVFIGRHLALAYRMPTSDRVQTSVKTMLFGMIPLDAVLLLGQGLWTAAIAVATLMVPARLLGRWMYVT